jgi:hypothetical protein
MHIFSLVSILATVSSYVLANPPHDLELLSTGNKAFRDNIAATDPGLLQKLADEGQCMRRLPSKFHVGY